MKMMLSVLALALLSVTPALAAESSAVIEEAIQATQARKMEAVARIIVLEGDAKASFDGLYAEFQDALHAQNEQYAGLAWRLLEKSTVPTVEETKRIIRDFRDLEVKKLDLRETYFEKFATLLEPAQLIRLFQLENKADVLLKHAAVMQIPFLE